MYLNYQHIGARIKAERNRMRLTQAQLAELVDLSVQYISQIERGVRHLSLEVIANIAVTLNASVDMLMFGTCCNGIEKKNSADIKHSVIAVQKNKMPYWRFHWL